MILLLTPQKARESAETLKKNADDLCIAIDSVHTVTNILRTELSTDEIRETVERLNNSQEQVLAYQDNLKELAQKLEDLAHIYEDTDEYIPDFTKTKL